MNIDSFLTLLHFSDGLLPVGSYAHSFGLEAYVAEGTVRDAAGVESFLRSYLQGSVAPTDVVAMLAARRAALPGLSVGMDECLSIDQNLDAMKPVAELRAASRQMGRQLLRITANLGDSFTSNRLIPDLFCATQNDVTPGHHAMAFGAVGGALGWLERDMACAYLYSTCAGIVACSLRLVSLGQLAGQRILWSLHPAISALAEEVQGMQMADVWSFAPGIEIAAMRHETLDARLFRS